MREFVSMHHTDNNIYGGNAIRKSVPLGDGSRNKGFLELGRRTAKDLQSLFCYSSSNRSVWKYQIQVVW